MFLYISLFGGLGLNLGRIFYMRERRRRWLMKGMVHDHDLWSVIDPAWSTDVRKRLDTPLTPWLSQNPPPPHLGGDLAGLEGRTCCTARQTIFRMTGFTFDRGLVKTNWQNKGQQINDPCSHPSPLDLDSVLPSPFLTFEFHTYNWTVRCYPNPHMHVHMHARAPEHMHTLIP